MEAAWVGEADSERNRSPGPTSVMTPLVDMASRMVAVQGASFDAAALADGEFAKEEGEVAAAAFSTASSSVPSGAAALYTASVGEKVPTDTAVLRTNLEQAVWQDTAAANSGRSNGNIATQMLERLEKMHADDVRAWIEKMPQLKQPLDLMRSIDRGRLAAVAKAAKVEIKLTPGSVDDVAELLATGKPRVNFLDLRRATVAQALDWILQRLSYSRPGRLKGTASLRPATGGATRIQVGPTMSRHSCCHSRKISRSSTTSKRHRPRPERGAVNEFLVLPRKELNVEDETSLDWFAPGQLLVFGRECHAQVAKAIETLQQGKAGAGSALGQLSAQTHKRFTARKEKLARVQASRVRQSVAMAFDQFSWQLLAASAGGQTDLEALTELQIAWKSPQTAELLSGAGRPLGALHALVFV